MGNKSLDGRWVALAGAAGAALLMTVGPGASLRRRVMRRLRGDDPADPDETRGRLDYTWEPAADPARAVNHPAAAASRPEPLRERSVGMPLGSAVAVERPLPGSSASRLVEPHEAARAAPTGAAFAATAPVDTTRSQEHRARSGGPLTLHLPTDRRIGTVYASESPETSALGYAWAEVGPARGDVTVPAGRHARLDVDDEAARDLSWLSVVGNGLHTLNMPKDQVTDAQLAHLAGLTSLRHLDLSDTPITDAGLAHLRGLTELENLNLSNTRVTDAGLADLAAMRHLDTLHLYGTGVTDAGLRHLSGLTHLRELTLNDTAVSDEGLRHLGGLQHLATLDLTGTRITDSGLAALRGLRGLRDLKLLASRVTGVGAANLREHLPHASIVHEAR